MTSPLQADTCSRIAEIDPDQWDSLVNAPQNPCASHAFLSTLEDTGCVGAQTGWTPLHHVLRNEDGAVVAAAPAYIKTHSRGEFVFDWAWADALERAGHPYYPKLVVAIPFTPVPGPRLAAHDEATQSALTASLLASCDDLALSSAHVLFPTDSPPAQASWLERRDLRYIWENHGYENFDDFMQALSSKRRKEIRRERRRLAEQGIQFRVVAGETLDDDEWHQVYALYARTYHVRGQSPYLSQDFFPTYAARAPGQVLITQAHHDGKLLAVAIAIRGNDCLFGRHWGTAIDVHSLHFETCYYQGIEYCIEHGLNTYDAGVQGEQKRMRGFEPAITQSMHYIVHSGLRHAVANFLNGEREAVDQWADEASAHSAFRQV